MAQNTHFILQKFSLTISTCTEQPIFLHAAKPKCDLILENLSFE